MSKEYVEKQYFSTVVLLESYFKLESLGITTKIIRKWNGSRTERRRNTLIDLPSNYYSVVELPQTGGICRRSIIANKSAYSRRYGSETVKQYGIKLLRKLTAINLVWGAIARCPFTASAKSGISRTFGELSPRLNAFHHYSPCCYL